MANTAVKEARKALPVESKIPCTHGPDGMCDVCLVWTGVQAFAMEAKLWKVGAKWSVTCVCHNHPTPFCVELSRKLEGGCTVAADTEQTEKKMLLDFVRDFLKEFGDYSDVNEWTTKMVDRARRLVKLCGKR